MHLVVFSVLLLIAVTSADPRPNHTYPASITSCDINGQPISSESIYNAKGRQFISISCLVFAYPAPTATITAGQHTVISADFLPLPTNNDYNHQYRNNYTFYAMDTTYGGQWTVYAYNSRPCATNNCQFNFTVNIDAVTITPASLVLLDEMVVEPLQSSGLIAFQTHTCDEVFLCLLPSGTPDGNWLGEYGCFIYNDFWGPVYDSQYDYDYAPLELPADCSSGSPNPVWIIINLQQSGGNPNTVQVTRWSSPQFVYNTPLNATNPQTFSYRAPYTVTQVGIWHLMESEIIYYPNAV